VPVPPPCPWLTVSSYPVAIDIPRPRHLTQRLVLSAAGALFANSVIRGMNGEKGVVTPTFVKSPLYEDQGVEYFSSNVELGVSLLMGVG